jgi:cobalt-zinc-cadmium efflux system outer membrane protein
LSPTPPTLSREEAVTRALTVRPDLTLARAEVAMARIAPPQEMAGGGMEPMGMMGMMGCTSNGEGRGLNAISTWGDSPSSQGLRQYATAPPPFQNLVQGKTLAAAARVQVALDRLDSMVLMIRQEVAAAFIQYDAAQHALDIYAQGVREPARQNLEIVRKAYELGRIPLLEVINEQRKYIDIEMGYAEALKEAYDAGVEIERAVGAVNL